MKELTMGPDAFTIGSLKSIIIFKRKMNKEEMVEYNIEEQS